MSVGSENLQPLPLEADINVAHQMALYAQPAELALKEARATAALRTWRTAQATALFAARTLGIGRDQLIANELYDMITRPIFHVPHLSLTGIAETQLRLAEADVHWVGRLELAAHYRALHGQYDYRQGIDNSKMIDLVDKMRLSCRHQIDQGSGQLDSIDDSAIHQLANASPAAAALAYSSIKSQHYRPSSTDLLREMAIMPQSLEG